MMEVDEVDSDPVISEVDVFATSALSQHLYLIQYPIHPAHLTSPGGEVVGGRVRAGGSGLQLDIGIMPRGENYSTSRGEQYGRTLDPHSDTAPPSHRSGLMDRQTLASSSSSQHDCSRYAAAVYKDGELHLTPLRGVMQLRPCLARLDRADKVDSRRVSGAGGSSEGEGTESEGEEAKPVQIRFARPTNSTSTSSARRPLFQQQEQQRAEETWLPVTYHGMHSEAATEERKLLFAPMDDQASIFSLSQREYLDHVCPVEGPRESEAPIRPVGVLSLDQLKSMPLPQQVRELLKREQVVQFSWLVSMLGGRSQAGALSEALDGCGVLVQGCWVVRSELLHPGEEGKTLRRARDYILWCFSQNRLIGRKDIAVITKVPHDHVRDILQSVAKVRPGHGWEFKMATDTEFMSSHPQLVHKQEVQWSQKHKQLVLELGLPKEHSKQSMATATADAPPAKVSSDSQAVSSGHLPPSSVPLPPTSGAVSVKVDPELNEAVLGFCQGVLGMGVLSLSDIRDKLLLRQASAGAGDALRAGVPDTLLEKSLLAVGALEVGQATGKRLFAVERTGRPTDAYRGVILKMFQTMKSVRRKQVLDEITKELGVEPDSKAISSVLKELCYSRGSQWYIGET